MKTAEANILSICNAIEFVEEHLKEEITITDIADAVFYSLYHFCRMFNSIVHHTPYDYLMRRRLSESARELIGTDKKIIEIAFDYQFNSPEVFARAFKRMFGMQPNQWRKRGKIPKKTLMPQLTCQHIRYRNTHDALKPVIVEKETVFIAGLMTLVRDDLSVTIRLWKFLEQETLGSGEDISFRRYYSLRSYPELWEENEFFYLVGVAISSPEDVQHPLFVLKHLPAGQYVRVLHDGCDDERSLTLDYLYHTWLPKSGKRFAFPMEIDCWSQDVTKDMLTDSVREIFLPIE